MKSRHENEIINDDSVSIIFVFWRKILCHKEWIEK